MTTIGAFSLDHIPPLSVLSGPGIHFLHFHMGLPPAQPQAGRNGPDPSPQSFVRPRPHTLGAFPNGALQSTGYMQIPSPSGPFTDGDDDTPPAIFSISAFHDGRRPTQVNG